jgi:hypothetical protein
VLIARISRFGNKKANEVIRKYRPGDQKKKNHMNATGYTSFCPAISSSNTSLHPSSLDFIKSVVALNVVFETVGAHAFLSFSKLRGECGGLFNTETM